MLGGTWGIAMADSLTTIPVLPRRVLVEIALVWFEQGTVFVRSRNRRR